MLPHILQVWMCLSFQVFKEIKLIEWSEVLVLNSIEQFLPIIKWVIYENNNKISNVQTNA